MAEEYGFKRMTAQVDALTGEGTQTVSERLIAAVEAYTGNAPPEDDRTVVVRVG